MKKVLSVLLIAAIAFGGYAGYMNIQDVLECKDYWEEEGRISDENLDKLDDGIAQLEENTDAYVDGKAQYNDGLAQYTAGLAQLKAGEQDLASLGTLIKGLQTINGAFTSGAFQKGVSQLKAGEKQIAGIISDGAIAPELAQSLAYVLSVNRGTTPKAEFADLKDCVTGLENSSQTLDDYSDYVAEFSDDLSDASGEINDAVTVLNNTQSSLAKIATGKKETINSVKKKFVNAQADFNAAIDLLVTPSDATAAAKLKGAYGGVVTNLNRGENYYQYATEYASNPEFVGGITATITGAKTQAGTLDAYNKQITPFLDGFETLLANKNALASGLVKAYSGILSTPTLKNGVEKVDPFASLLLGIYAQIDYSQVACDYFADVMLSGVDQILVGPVTINKGLLPGFISAKADGAKTLAAGKVKLADAAVQLADGKAKLGEYEDGTDALKDGLDQLMATEANGGLKSIADRVGNKEFVTKSGIINFDNASFAVKKGREYSDDSGVLITEEITTRAVGTIVGLVSALFGLIAALLAFANKNKGAGIFAALTAIAAAAGAFVIKSAGTEFTLLAGSTIGSLPIIAFGAIAVVGVIVAIACFSAAKAA